MPTELFLQVAVPSPLRRIFDYKPPKNFDSVNLKPGIRVEVPFGNRRLIGFVLGISSSSNFPEGKIKAVTRIVDTETILDQQLLQLYQWAAEYYHYPIGQALQTSLPSQLRLGKPALAQQAQYLRLTHAGKILQPDTLKRAPRQLQIINLLKKYEAITATEIKEELGFAPASVLSTLVEKGFIEKYVPASQPISASGFLYGKNQPLPLNSQQQIAVDQIRSELNEFTTSLLEGVTGSGKTEIYLQLIADVLEAGKQVLVLVPEISLTPQTIQRFEDRFNRTIVAFHSGLSNSQRLAAWLQAGDGTADIIIGTRSAIFTPLARPGLIIIDEEHDASYKQQDGFRYSGRDLAIFRARQLNIPVILGTATPSLESLNNALVGRYNYLQLSERAGDAIQPVYRLLDMKGQKITEGLSEDLINIISSHLEKNKQVLIFLNRRGFSPLLLCRDCGWIATCPRCDASYTLHRSPPKLSCHHCEGQKPMPAQCQECSGTDLAAMGQGTEKIEQALATLIPGYPVYRIDRDSTRKRNALQNMLDKVNSGSSCILVGTQMLSKGHHFPNVTLVAILDADGGLFSADFRGQEQMGQLITQVAGRAGRGKTPGEVVIQTYNSTHPTIQALVGEGYGPFAKKLLEERKLGNLPPFSFMAVVRAEAAHQLLPEKFLSSIKETVSSDNKRFNLIGPIPSFMEKRGGLYRFQLIIEASRRSQLQQCLSLLLPVMENHPEGRKVRWSVDVDPVDFT